MLDLAYGELASTDLNQGAYQNADHVTKKTVSPEFDTDLWAIFMD